MADELEKKDKRTIGRIILRLIIIVIIIHLFLTLSRCTIKKEYYVEENVSSIISETKTETIEKCEDVQFNWEYAWEGWNNQIDQIITPLYRLNNLESRSGIFIVDFAFFDDSVYPFKQFEGKDYEEVEEILSWTAASMHFTGFNKILGPKESILISPSVRKKDSAKTYWVYANVYPPAYLNCSVVYNTSSINKTIIVKENVKKNITITLTLFEILKQTIFKEDS